MYFLVNAIMYLLSLLPWQLMYVLSDLISILLYYVLSYRKQVVMANLLLAFPEKTLHERQQIAAKFYKNLTDTFLEMIKLISISEQELNKRFVCNYEVVNDLYDSGKNVQIHGGHFFNWEFANLAYANNIQYPFLGVYQPLSNSIFDRIIYNMRGRFGTYLISTYEFRNRFFTYAKNNRYALALAADQNPGRMNNAFWLPFFGKMAPFVNGPEKGAVSRDTAIVFAHVYKVKRGFYKCDFSLYTTEPKQIEKGKITIDYRNFVEEVIRKNPDNYLWSHRRWKWTYDATQHANTTLELAKA